MTEATTENIATQAEAAGPRAVKAEVRISGMTCVMCVRTKRPSLR